MTPSHNPNLHPVKDAAPLAEIPSGMDNDPHADEEIIDQTGPQPSAAETELKPNANSIGLIPSQQTHDPATDDNLNEKIAYAMNGTEPKKN